MPVQEVELLEGGKAVLLRLANEDVRPVDQMRIRFALPPEEGLTLQETVYMTIHRVPAAR